MAHTPDGMKRFARTISTKRDGVCEYCGRTTRTGVDFAGVNGESKWTSVCATCAASITEQCKAVIVTMNNMGDDADLSTIDMAVLPTVLAGQATEAASYDMLLRLQAVRTAMIATKAATVLASQPVNPIREALAAIASNPQASPGDRDFATSLVRWLDTRGPLTERQQAAGERLVARYGTTTATDLPVLDNGLYVADDGTIYKLYTTQNGHQGCKRLEVYETGVDEDGKATFSGSLEYFKGGVRIVRQGVANGTIRALTMEEAQAFGTLHGFCCNCATDIDDDRSLAVGYGPVCAKRYDWYYPTYPEAANILGRPVTASNGRVYEPTVAEVRQSDGTPIRTQRDQFRAHND